MKTPIIAAAALLAFVGPIMAVPAMAADDAATCRSLSKDVATAMSSASGDVAQARGEQQAGLQSCRFGHYDNGAAHYRKALEMLGGSTSAGGAVRTPAR